MSIKYGVLAAAIILSQSAFAAVTITAPEEIAILAVNDQEVNAGLFRGKSNNYKVDAGQVSLSVRYEQLFDHSNGEHDVLKSGVVTIKTPALQDGANYKLALVNAPKDFDAAKKFVEQPTIALFDAQGQLLVQQTGANTEAKPLFGKGLFGRVYDLTIPKAPINQPAPVYVASTANTATTTTVAAAPVVVSTQVTSNSAKDQQLIQLWQQASKAERQNFLNWITDQAK